METCLQKGCRPHKMWKYLITEMRSVNSTSDKEAHNGHAKIKFRLWGRKPKSRISMQFYIQSPGGRQRSNFSVRKKKQNRKEQPSESRAKGTFWDKMLPCTSIQMGPVSPTPPHPSPGMFLAIKPCPFPCAGFNTPSIP